MSFCVPSKRLFRYAAGFMTTTPIGLQERSDPWIKYYINTDVDELNIYVRFVIVISKLRRRHSRASAGHQLVHERCVKSRGCPDGLMCLNSAGTEHIKFVIESPQLGRRSST